nr:MAG TPA: hypothetical protein [Caudoviricetes sp.]
MTYPSHEKKEAMIAATVPIKVNKNSTLGSLVLD